MTVNNLPFIDPAELIAPWRQFSACRGVEKSVFFPPRGEVTERAKVLCSECPVAAVCLEYALDHFIKVGVYGGRSERERRKMRRARREAVKAGQPYPPLDPLRPEGVRRDRMGVPMIPRRKPGHKCNGRCKSCTATKAARLAQLEGVA